MGAASDEEREATFRRLFETGPINLALIDQSGAVQEYSRAFGVFADAKGALIGASFVELFDEKDHESLFAAIQAVGEGGAQEPVVARLAAGRKESCAVIFTELQDAPRLIAASIQDVTQEKKLEAQFAQSQKMLAVGQLAGGVAHDFNNLLTAIIGHADLLMLKYSPSDDSFADINQIKQNANRAANLVRQLLAFSRQQTLQPRVLDVGDTLADLGNLLRRLLGAGVVLNIRHGRDMALVKVDRVQLEQVVINLAVNARDAMKGHGELDISTKMAEVGDTAGSRLEPMPAGSYVRIDVSDHGVGIEPEHLDRIFEPFFTTKAIGEGTGLGLSTVYGIVKQTGGFIFVDSEVGKGTTFSLYL
ncbi:MAG: ATP-binding protein, partial [Alphaproteobacteria bacterium]